VIAFDNRGAGRSDKPVMEYSISLFADDTAGLMKALGIQNAHVLGISMGGYIAQELAIRHPEMVRSLILGCTSPGGNRAVIMSEERMKKFTANDGLTPEEILRKDMDIYFSDDFIANQPDKVKEFIEISLRHYQPPAAETAKLVIAEVTPHMPRTMGNSFIYVSKIDYIVECDAHPIKIPASKITSEDEAIGQYCADLVRDGDCLQLGIGALPDAVLACLKHKKHLGIHTEMFSDGVVDLFNASVIDCSEKNFHPGKMVATFFMGTEKLYQFVHNNPIVEMFSVDFTNNPSIIAQNNNMVSINSALEVDLMGQVVADTIGFAQYSGTGGQPDFVRGAAWSNGGRSIIALHSTAVSGTVSRIRPLITQGAAVTTDRTDVCYIVMEYGVANLMGKTIEGRAKELINIAHPNFRADLKRDFRRLYYQ